MIKLILSICIPIIAAILLNIYIYISGWNRESKESIPIAGLPPGYVIAIIWIFILGLLGYTFYLTYPSYSAWIIVLAILYCLAYPFLTSGLRQEKASIYNMLSLVIAMITAISVFMKNNFATLYVIPFVLWTMYVNIITNLQPTKK